MPDQTDYDQLRAVVARIRQMTDYWEQQLPEVIRTPAVVSAIRAALEPAAVLPAPTDQTAVLRDAADRIDATRAPFPIAVQNGITWATADLRRMAGEAQQDEPRPSCPDPIECGHETALGQAEMRLGQIRAKASEWQALAPANDWGDTPQDTQLADIGRYLLSLLDGAQPAAREAQQDPTQDGKTAPGRADGLRAAAAEADRAGGLYAARGDMDRAGAAFSLMETLTAMADCPACAAGIEHDAHCPTPETHNWDCACPAAVVRPGQPETEA